MNDLADNGDRAHAERASLIACLTQISHGDKSALEDLYRRTSSKLFAVCLRILSDRGEAEDVLQDVYMTVWSKAARFDAVQGLSPITWLSVIARNRSLDRLRSKKRRFAAMDEAAKIADSAPLADALLQASDTGAKLFRCLEDLEDRAAAAIRHAYFGGLTYETLARQNDVPLGTMKSLIRRALMRLKVCLES